MKLLFAKHDDENSANEELKELLGHISGSFKWKNLKSDIITSSLEFIKIIGADTYDYLFELYKEEKKDLILYKSQYAIALKAIRYYLPKNDIAITNNGRVMYRDDNTVSAFEHQIVNQNEALERDYYKTLDQIFLLLDDENPIISVGEVSDLSLKWKDTNPYKETEKFFITCTEEFDKYFLIESRYLYQKLIPAIKICMEIELTPRIPQDLYVKTLKKEEGYNMKLYYYCQMACVFYSLSWAVKRLRITLLPEGVSQKIKSERNTIKSTKIPVKAESELVAQEFNNDFLKAVREIEILVSSQNNNELSKSMEKPTHSSGNKKYISL